MCRIGSGRDDMAPNRENSASTYERQSRMTPPAPVGCAACTNRRPDWFCSLGKAGLADLEKATGTIFLPAQAALFKQGEEARRLRSEERRVGKECRSRW